MRYRIKVRKKQRKSLRDDIYFFLCLITSLFSVLVLVLMLNNFSVMLEQSHRFLGITSPFFFFFFFLGGGGVNMSC